MLQPRSPGFTRPVVAVGAATALALARGRGAALTASGAVLTSLGAITLALSDMAHGAVGFALAGQVDPATSFEIHMAYFQNPAILGLNTGPMLITAGMLLLGAGLLRSPAMPRWVGAVVLLSPIGVHLGFILELPTYLHGVPFVVGMTVLAYALLSSSQPPYAPLGYRFARPGAEGKAGRPVERPHTNAASGPTDDGRKETRR